jgi:cytochrome b6-f complex iron-sulfur subunit
MEHERARGDDAVAGCGGCGGVSRREFVERAGLAALAAAFLASCANPTGPNLGTASAGVTVVGNKITIDLTVATQLTQAQGGIIVNTATTPVLVLNAGAGTYRALNGVCPHEGRTNGWSYDGSTVVCVFHNSTFSSSGSLLGGPSPTGLRSYATSVSGTTLTVTVA